MTNLVFPIDFNSIRKTIINEISRVTLLDANHVVFEEPESQNVPRPSRPYMAFKITGPADKQGDDSWDNVDGSTWNSGGVRKLTISFHSYGRSHEEAYNYMALWQSYLNTEVTYERLRLGGIAVWTVGSIADLSNLLNTGYEGRSHMECTFGIASNLVVDYGQIDHADIEGTINDTISITVSI